MKALLYLFGDFAILLLAFSSPAFAARMLDYAGPAELPSSTKPEETESAVTEMVEGDEAPDDDAEVKPESPEGSEDDLPVAEIPAPPPSRWKFSESAAFGASTDDNIFLRPNHKQSDDIYTLSGTFGLLWGLKREESYLKIDYTPSLLRYADHSELNSFDQAATLEGQWRMAKLTLALQVSFQSLSGADVDVGAQADRRIWEIALQAKYDLSTKTSIEVDLAPNSTNYQNYLGSLELVNSNWIDYQILPKTRLGAGLALGLLKPEGGTQQTYQQALVRVRNPVSGKLTLDASGGIEYRQFGGGGGTQTTPVFHVGATYQPYGGTEIALEASRQIYSSAAIVGQDYATTGGSVSIRQQLQDRLYAKLSGGYEDAAYESADGSAGGSRHDQYFFVSPSLTLRCAKWLRLEIYYHYRRNISTASIYGFDDTVTGAEATISF